MQTRRGFLKTVLGGGLGFFSLGGYAFAVEPRLRLSVTRHVLALPHWPREAKPLRAAILTDLHASDPWMPLGRIAEIVAETNRLAPDIVFLLGDYMSSLRWHRRALRPDEWAPLFAELRAPLGVHAILGNHDYWWEGGADPVVAALRRAGVAVRLNDALRIDRDGHRFWVSGTESTMALRYGPGDFGGRDDIAAALAGIDDDAPIIHLAHEPAFLPNVPERVALTLSGHTHGGQISLPFLGAPIARHYDLRWIHGHYRVDGRNLVVSSGLGCTFLPVRFLVPPEITLVEVSGQAIA
jgi:predicted MPP superfamily phosphohydrolase